MPKRPAPPPHEEPKKKDDPKKDGEEEQPKGDKPPRRASPAPAEPVVPEAYRHMLEPKDGYANYYFNRLQQERVLAGLALFESWKGAAGRWKVAGKTSAGAEFTLTLSNKGIGLTLPDAPYLQPLGDETAPIDEPPGSGGLLIALHQFRLLLTQGKEAFSDFYYLGSEPLDGRGELVDVLVSRKEGVETRWYFRRSDLALIGFDSSLGGDVDPAEIRFLDVATVSGRPFPSRFLARCGEREFATFVVSSLDVAGGAN
jgi:serine protease Do